MAMPTMTPELRQSLATALASERERLRKSLATLAETTRALGESQSDASNAGGEPVAEAIDLEEQELELLLEYLEADRLAAVEAALHRLAENAYGTCEDCGRPVGAERLAAIPWTSRCIACAQRAEAMAGEAPFAPGAPA
jgi:RNA polymerase-binding transcription factor DksA